MDTGIRVGHDETSEIVEKTAAAILSIMSASGDRDVLLGAFKALGQVAGITGTTITNCTFSGVPQAASVEPPKVAGTYDDFYRTN